MLPMTLLNVFDVGIWHLMPHGILRWIVCTALLIFPAMLLSRTLNRKQKLQTRTYRYAD
jgi:NADH-quinone oxidoreductase subunit H